jgi:hypothetical protein
MQAEPNSDRFVAYFSLYSREAGAVLMFSVLFSGAFLTDHPRNVSAELALLVSSAILALGAVIVALVAYRMRGPRLVIDREGILWVPPVYKPKAVTIPWSSIERIEAWDYPGLSGLPPHSLTLRLSDGKTIAIFFVFIRPGFRAAVRHLQSIGISLESRHLPTMREYARHVRTTVPSPSDKD